MTNIPPNAPRCTLPDGREILVAVTSNPFQGVFIGVATKQTDGSYVFLNGGGDQFATDQGTFDADVAVHGGTGPWLGAVGIPRINQILATNYLTDPNDVKNLINGVLGQCKLSIKNGVPGFY